MKDFEDTDREGATMDSGKLNMAEEEDHGRPTPDAEVREAVEPCPVDGFARECANCCHHPCAHRKLRAVQAPRFPKAIDWHRWYMERSTRVDELLAEVERLKAERGRFKCEIAAFREIRRADASKSIKLLRRERESISYLNRVIRAALAGGDATLELLETERDKERHSAEAAEARVRELEAFKSRVLEWARSDCYKERVCGNHKNGKCVTVDGVCRSGFKDGTLDNWAPPKAWEVGE